MDFNMQTQKDLEIEEETRIYKLEGGDMPVIILKQVVTAKGKQVTTFAGENARAKWEGEESRTKISTRTTSYAMFDIVHAIIL